MTLAGYLNIATALGLSRRDAMLMEIATVYAMVALREKSAGAGRKRRNDNPWP